MYLIIRDVKYALFKHTLTGKHIKVNRGEIVRMHKNNNEWDVHNIPSMTHGEKFIAYDLYNRSFGRFASTENLHGLLHPQDEHDHDANAKQPLIPIVYKGSSMPDMIQTKSRFYDGRVEGVYVKVERGDAVMRRAKVVRGEFIAGNEHWTREG